jgi:hypothetical protein
MQVISRSITQRHTTLLAAAVLASVLGCGCGNGGTVVSVTPTPTASATASVPATPPPAPRWDNPWSDAVVGEWAIYRAGIGADGTAIEDYCEVTAREAGVIRWSRQRDAAGTSQNVFDEVKLDGAGSEWFRRTKDDAKVIGTEKIEVTQGEAPVVLDCQVIEYATAEGTIKIWFSPAFPLDGVVKEMKDGAVVREATYFDVKAGE